MVAKAGVVDEEMASLPQAGVVTSGSGKRRADPAPAPLDAVLSQGQLTNKRADKHYAWVSKVGDPTFNIGTYKALGYKIEYFHANEPDQTRPTWGAEEYADGDPIEAYACVLMSCPLELKLERERVQQERVTAMQKRIQGRAHIQPLSSQEQHDFRHINFEPHGGDNRPSWE